MSHNVSGDQAASIPLPRGRSLRLGGRSLVMGIINVTPDSFYPGSRIAPAPGAAPAQGGQASQAERACAAALAMFEAGAAIVDVGGESTRPGAAAVSLDEELSRVIPVIRAIRRESDVPISVDTRNSAVAQAAIEAGADIINDVSALGHDSAMCALAAASGLPLVLMHMKGEPGSMQDSPFYEDCPAEVLSFLLGAAARAEAAGVARDRIILDPGIGFGKRLKDNLALIARLDELVAAGYPVLVGLSRKRFIEALTGRPVEGRLAGSLGAACAAWLKGARLFRVHDVAQTVDALAVLEASLSGRRPQGMVSP